MSKLTCANIPGHYEGDGIEIDVFPTQIIARTRGQPQQVNKERFHKEQQPRRQPDDENKSLLASVTTLVGKFQKK